MGQVGEQGQARHGQTTYEFTDTIRSIARKYYPDGELYMAGDATNEYDFQKSFAIDNVVVNVVSIFIVLLVLLFTFQSVGMPILLPRLPRRQLHPDGREHRLRDRHRYPFQRAEG